MLETQSNDRFEMCNILKVLVIICSLLFVCKYFYHRTAPIIVRIKDPEFSLLGPYNSTEYELDDVYLQLIDIKDFSFEINPQPCQDYPYGLLLVVIVSSKPDNFKKRRVIRETWGRNADYTKVVYLLGQTNDSAISKRVENESLTYGDIVQGSFIDAYRNMTYKHVMGLKWVSYYCSTAKYVLKTDDDVVVNSHELQHFLARELSPWGAKGLITCPVFYSSVVERGNSKWGVSEEEYAGKYYPNYCAGFAIIYSQDVVNRLLSTAQKMPYFWIDDAHITGIIAEKIGLARTPLGSLVLDGGRMNLLTSHKGVDVGQFLFGPQDISPNKISEVWKAIRA